MTLSATIFEGLCVPSTLGILALIFTKNSANRIFSSHFTKEKLRLQEMQELIQGYTAGRNKVCLNLKPQDISARSSDYTVLIETSLLENPVSLQNLLSRLQELSHSLLKVERRTGLLGHWALLEAVILKESLKTISFNPPNSLRWVCFWRSVSPNDASGTVCAINRCSLYRYF